MARRSSSSTPPSSSRTVQRREQRQRQRRRQQLTIGASIAIVALIAITLIVIINRPLEAPLPDTALSRYTGLPVGLEARGFPRLGEAENSIRVQLFGSFSSEASLAFYQDAYPALLERVRAGHVSLVFLPVDTLGSIPNARAAAQASLCAADQEAFWPYHDSLFAWHVQYGNQAFPSGRLIAGAQALNLNMGSFNACAASTETLQRLETARDQFVRAAGGLNDLPLVLVSGVSVGADIDDINESIDDGLRLLGIDPEATREVLPPTAPPTETPTETPTAPPTETPTLEPSTAPTEAATSQPTSTPSLEP